MSDKSISDRGKALEDAFFARENAALRERLKRVEDEQQRKAAFTAASGISDERVLQQLSDLRIDVDTLTAFSLVPVVLVAWADGSIDERERSAVLSAAAEAGLAAGTASHALLEGWLSKRPAPELLAVWKNYMRALTGSLEPDAKQMLRSEILGRARRTAEAAGGFLGFGTKISKEEQDVLADLDTAFANS